MAYMDDPRRRRRGPGASGYDGIGGAAALPGMLLPFLQGLPSGGYSGGGGLMGFLQAMGGGGQGQQMSPAFRNFQNQGFDFMPPGLDNRNAPGGPNVAPGNIDNNQALDQPRANPTPGIPRGVGLDFAPGQVGPPPQTQGWRNYAPGFREAAKLGYGGPQFGGGQYAPGGGLEPPGVQGGGGPGRGPGGPPGASGGGGGGSQSPSPPKAAAGGGGGEFSGPRPNMGPGPGGGGKGGPGEEFRPGGRNTDAGGPSQASANRAQVRAGTASGGEKVGPNQVGNQIGSTGGPTTKAGQDVVFGPGVGGPIVEVAPQKGTGGKGVSRAPGQRLHKPPKPKPKPPKPAPRTQPPSVSSFQVPNAPKPSAGKTKPKPKPSGSKQLR